MKAATRHNVSYAASPTISIHAAREGGDSVHCVSVRQPLISIHAAREGGDAYALAFQIIEAISIHAAREGGDCSR